ncbi:MAG TPA: hypothetical protein VFW33_01060 [Gemmataceae bacterium]|nr:hypothetical protein [Gemmataceae bacterium]
MTTQNTQRPDPDLARRVAGLSPKPAGPEPPGTGYASPPEAGTGPTDICAPEGPETERGGSPESTSRLNEPEDRQ